MRGYAHTSLIIEKACGIWAMMCAGLYRPLLCRGMPGAHTRTQYPNPAYPNTEYGGAWADFFSALVCLGRLLLCVRFVGRSTSNSVSGRCSSAPCDRDAAHQRRLYLSPLRKQEEDARVGKA